MSNSKSPHAATLEIVFTHLKSGSFHNGGKKKAPWWSISPLYSFPKTGEELCLSKMLQHTNFDTYHGRIPCTLYR